VSLNPLSEVKYRWRLAMEHLARAERAMQLNDWASVVSAAQLAIENFAKAVVACSRSPREAMTHLASCSESWQYPRAGSRARPMAPASRLNGQGEGAIGRVLRVHGD